MPMTNSVTSSTLTRSSVDTVTVESGQVSCYAESLSVHPALKRFIFLANKITSETTVAATTLPNMSSIQSQQENYLMELQQRPSAEDALTFWRHRHASYSQLADLAEDLIAGPASQAFVGRIFSLCDWLMAGRINRLTKTFELRVFLKSNAHLM